MVKLLLENGASRAKKIKEDYVPLFQSAKEFLDYQDSINTSGDRITYHEDGTAVIKNTAPVKADTEEKV